jgi:ABC-type branched-subunit amino acid transport system ATPase component
MSLDIQNLSVAYGVVTALRDVNIEVKSGVITTIIGSNGAGKTTLMKAIAGLLRSPVAVFCTMTRICRVCGPRRPSRRGSR